MKRLILMMVLSIFCVAMNANIAETEPNNDFQHAQAVEVNTPVKGTQSRVKKKVHHTAILHPPTKVHGYIICWN